MIQWLLFLAGFCFSSVFGGRLEAGSPLGVAQELSESGVRFTSAQLTASEVLPEIMVQIDRVGPPGQPFSVQVTTVSDSALPDRDFVGIQQRVEFGPNDLSVTVPVRLLDNDQPNPPRSFLLRLSESEGVAGITEPSETRVNLWDNERTGGLVGNYFPPIEYLQRLSSAAIFRDGSVIALSNAVAQKPSDTSGVAIRFDPDGGLDPLFRSEPGKVRRPLLALPNGDWLALSTASVQRAWSPILRLRPDGSSHPEWPNTLLVPSSQTPSLFTTSPDATVYVGASQIIQGSVSIDRLARILPDGTLDPAFRPALDTGLITALDRDTEGRLYIGGTFSQVDGVPRRRIARLWPDGRLDHNFLSGADPGISSDAGLVFSIVALPDGGCLAGGTFTHVNGLNRPQLVRLLPDGTVDSDFRLPGEGLQVPHGTPEINGLHRDDQGRVLFFGYFLQLDGRPVNFPMLRLLPNGFLDEAFDPSAAKAAPIPDSTIFSAMLVPSGMVTLFGRFKHVDGVPVQGLIRLHLDPPGTSQAPILQRMITAEDGPRLEFTLPKPGPLFIEGAAPGEIPWTWRTLDQREWPSGPGIWSDPHPETTGRVYRLRMNNP